jgi:hypothetical protein
VNETRAVIARLTGAVVALTLCALAAPAGASGAFGVQQRFETVAPPAGTAYAEDLAADVDGSVYVLNGGFVQKYAPSGTLVGTWGGYGSGPGQLVGSFPRAIEVDGLGHVYVADGMGNRIVVFTTDGAFVANWGAGGGDGTAGDGPGEYRNPYDLATDRDGNLYVVDLPPSVPSRPAHLQKLAPNGAVVAIRNAPSTDDMTVAPDGRLYSRGVRWILPETVVWLAPGDLVPGGPFSSGGFDLLPGPTTDERGFFPSSCCGLAVVGGRIWVGRGVIRDIEAYGLDGGFQTACPAESSITDIAAGHDGNLYALEGTEVVRYGEAPQPCAIPPSLQRVQLSERVLRASSYRRLRKARISFDVSEVGTVRITFTRLVEGRRVGRRCRRPTRRIRRRPLCVRRRVRELASPAIDASIGRNVVRVVDLVWRDGLRPGRYEIALVATDRNGLRSKPVTLRAGVTR